MPRSPPRPDNAPGTGSPAAGTGTRTPPFTGSCCYGCGTANRAPWAYFERRRAEQFTDRDIMRCLKRHIANEVYTVLLNPATDHPVGRELRARRQALGIPISVLAATIAVPYQRLRRLEIGTRADPELERRANLALTQIKCPQAA